MIHYQCDRCGRTLGANDARRFIVKIEAYAAAGPVEFTPDELRREHAGRIKTLIDELARADPDAVEDQTYRCLRFDLCADCHRVFLERPLG